LSGWIAKSRRSFPGPWDREVPVAAAALGVLVLFGCEEEQLVLIYVPVLGMKTGPPSVKPVGVCTDRLLLRMAPLAAVLSAFQPLAFRLSLRINT